MLPSRIRWVAVSVCATVLAAVQAGRAAADAVQQSLAVAKQAREDARASAKATLMRAIDAQIKEAADTGELAALKELTDQEDAFADAGALPTRPSLKDAAAAYDLTVRKADGQLVLAYEAAIEAYNGQQKRSEALVVRKQRRALLEGRADAATVAATAPVAGPPEFSGPALPQAQADPDRSARAAAAAAPRVVLSPPTRLAKTLPSLLEASEPYTVDPAGGIVPKEGSVIRTKGADYLAGGRDWLFDVWVKIDRAGPPAVVGVGDGTLRNSIGLLLRPTDDPHHGAHLVRGDEWGEDIVDVREPGVYVVRVERQSGTLTFSIGTEKDGKYDFFGSKTMVDPKAVMPRLDERLAHLFFGQGGLFKQYRINLGPPPGPAAAPPVGAPGAAAVAAPGTAAPGTAAAAGSMSAETGGVVPLGRLLPPQFTANGTYSALSDGGMIPARGTFVLTKASDFLSPGKEYVFDVWVKLEPTGGPTLVGVGDGKLEHSIGVLLRPTGDPHHGAHLVHGDPWGEDVADVREPGVYVIRVERQSGVLTFSVGTETDGAFDFFGSKTVVDAKAAMSELDERAARLFFGEEARFLKCQLRLGPPSAGEVVRRPAPTAAAEKPAKPSAKKGKK